MNRFLLQLLCATSLLVASAIPLLAADEATPAPITAPPLSLLPTLPITTPAPDSVTPTATSSRLGLVDINRISAESALGKAAQAKIKAQQGKLQKQVDSKRRQLDKLKADIERQLPTLAPAQREAKAKQFQKKVEEFQKFGMNAEKGLLETQEKLTRELLAAIEQAATRVGATKGLAAVVVKRELLYLASGTEAVDISEDITKLVDETMPKN
ncbi:OmpH family outer membrane protein [Trichlorobacter sp.]|uniref:OmpH family outer membrane protein n=1 Tax=Trichlorobacter sp. TaxID=2911007 RepID=UPI002A360833|nr:OmpH family outer membrane protein [Trichlorobacter sp.]MDY0383869.1 OmpH family outer membrane protein [Trichlorobacter sp.]